MHDPELRLLAKMKLAEFTDYGDSPYYTLLRKLLGKAEDTRLSGRFGEFTEEDRRICEALVGPNGYTIFRMLCIRRGINTSVKTRTTD